MTTTSIQALLDSMLIERTKLYAARRTVTRLCRDISKLREDDEAPCSAKRLARIHRLCRDIAKLREGDEAPCSAERLARIHRLCRDISQLREGGKAPCSAKRLARIHRLETRHWAMGRMIDTLDDTLKVLRYMDSLGREGDTR